MTDHHTQVTDRNTELATFHVGDALCGIDILHIREINKNSDITSVPRAADYIIGILNLRGSIVTIIDLARKLGLDRIKSGKDNRNIIVNSEDEAIGFRVDGIGDVVHGNPENMEPAPANLKGIKGKFFSNVVKTENQLIGILDMNEVLGEQSLKQKG